MEKLTKFEIQLSKLLNIEYEGTTMSRGEKLYLHLGEWADTKRKVVFTGEGYRFKIKYVGDEYVLDSMRLFSKKFRINPNEKLTLTLHVVEVQGTNDLVCTTKSKNTITILVHASFKVYYTEKWKCFNLSLVVDEIDKLKF